MTGNTDMYLLVTDTFKRWASQWVLAGLMVHENTFLKGLKICPIFKKIYLMTTLRHILKEKKLAVYA
jgi:hypothetical protein